MMYEYLPRNEMLRNIFLSNQMLISEKDNIFSITNSPHMCKCQLVYIDRLKYSFLTDVAG